MVILQPAIEYKINIKNKEEQHFYHNGEKVQILAPEQKYSTNQSGYERKQFSNMSIGKLVKGMATGKWQGAEKELHNRSVS